MNYFYLFRVFDFFNYCTMLSVYSFFIVLFLRLFFVVVGTDPRPSHILSNHNYSTNMQHTHIYEHFSHKNYTKYFKSSFIIFFLELLFCLLLNHFLREMDKAGPVL